MADYEIGYGKPPKYPVPARHSGNPKGRPRRAQIRWVGCAGVLDAPVQYRENGRTKTASRTELRLKMMLEKAVKGDVGAAEALLDERKHALKDSGAIDPAGGDRFAAGLRWPDRRRENGRYGRSDSSRPPPSLAAEPVGGGEREQVTDK